MSCIEERTIRYICYVVGQPVCKRIAQAFGLIKTVVGQDKTGFHGYDQIWWTFIFAAAQQSDVIAEAHCEGRPMTKAANPTKIFGGGSIFNCQPAALASQAEFFNSC